MVMFSHLHLVGITSCGLQTALMGPVDLVGQNIQQHLAVAIRAQVPRDGEESIMCKQIPDG